jgi:hypothetical protein
MCCYWTEVESQLKSDDEPILDWIDRIADERASSARRRDPEIAHREGVIKGLEWAWRRLETLVINEHRNLILNEIERLKKLSQ